MRYSVRTASSDSLPVVSSSATASSSKMLQAQATFTSAVQHHVLVRSARLPGMHNLLVKVASQPVRMTPLKRIINNTGRAASRDKCYFHLLSVTTRCSGTRRMTSPSLMSRAATVESMT